MTTPKTNSSRFSEDIKIERTFRRFTLAQRWEHFLLILSVTMLLLTGLPQKYYYATWSQWILSTPERLELVQQIHHIFALLLIAEILYHLVRAISLMIRHRLSAEIFPTVKDFQDAWQTLKYLLFITKEKPKFGKFNFEQKFTYWFLFFSIGILVISGLILWIPLFVTRFLPGGVVPAAYLAHSNEAIATAVFILIWHFYHVHFQRLNLSMFTGRLTEEEMQKYHPAAYELAIEPEQIIPDEQGGSK